VVKSKMTVNTPNGDLEAETLFSDYRKEGDLLVAHKIQQTAPGRTSPSRSTATSSTWNLAKTSSTCRRILNARQEVSPAHTVLGLPTMALRPARLPAGVPKTAR